MFLLGDGGGGGFLAVPASSYMITNIIAYIKRLLNTLMMFHVNILKYSVRILAYNIIIVTQCPISCSCLCNVSTGLGEMDRGYNLFYQKML